jgi:hypothetical protein
VLVCCGLLPALFLLVGCTPLQLLLSCRPAMLLPLLLIPLLLLPGTAPPQLLQALILRLRTSCGLLHVV